MRIYSSTHIPFPLPKSKPASVANFVFGTAPIPRTTASTFISLPSSNLTPSTFSPPRNSTTFVFVSMFTPLLLNFSSASAENSSSNELARSFGRISTTYTFSPSIFEISSANSTPMKPPPTINIFFLLLISDTILFK